MTASPLEDLTALLMHFQRSTWREMHVRTGELEAWLARPGADARNPMAQRPASSAAPPPAEAIQTITVSAPHLGTYRTRRQPGEHVAKGEPLYDLELLGERIPVAAAQAGVVHQVGVQDGDLVEFEQGVLLLSPT